MNDIYIVTKEGIFNHGIFAISENKNKAIQFCDEVKELDIDYYHEWSVYKIPMNKLFKDIKKYPYLDGYISDVPIYKTRKGS